MTVTLLTLNGQLFKSQCVLVHGFGQIWSDSVFSRTAYVLRVRPLERKVARQPESDVAKDDAFSPFQRSAFFIVRRYILIISHHH